MQLGEVIRTYRKKKNMTQEEMARRLGVTAPAVNKWENGNSYPDIMLLAPIARLLDITVDTLLSFREELTTAEINEIVYEVDALLKKKPYDEALDWAKRKLAQYPNCAQLSWQMAVIFDAQRGLQGRESEEDDAYLSSLYLRALESGDEELHNLAAGSLFGFYMRRKQYEEAERLLGQVSKLNPERKRYLARLYSGTGRMQEAYREYEEMLFFCYQYVNGALQGMYDLASAQEDRERARMLAAKQAEAARCFEMGAYYEAVIGLEQATREKDAGTVLAMMRQLLDTVDEIGSCRKSPLYAHVTFKELSAQFRTELKDRLKKCFSDEESYGFLREEPEWRRLTEQK